MIHDPKYGPAAAMMRRMLDDYMEKTDDFASSGNFPRPEGMILNTVTCIDPDSNDPKDYE